MDIEKVSVFPMYNDKYVVEIIPTYRNFSKSIKQSDFRNTIKLPSVNPDGTIISYNEWTTELTNINLNISAPVLWRVDIYRYSNDTYAVPNPPFVAQILGSGIGLASGKYTFRGEYNNSEFYHNDNQQIDYVTYGTTTINGETYSQYYVRKGPEDVCTGIDPTNTEYWQPFAEFVALGAQFITADQIKARLIDTHKLTADNIDVETLVPNQVVCKYNDYVNWGLISYPGNIPFFVHPTTQITKNEWDSQNRDKINDFIISKNPVLMIDGYGYIHISHYGSTQDHIVISSEGITFYNQDGNRVVTLNASNIMNLLG